MLWRYLAEGGALEAGRCAARLAQLLAGASSREERLLQGGWYLLAGSLRALVSELEAEQAEARGAPGGSGQASDEAAAAAGGGAAAAAGAGQAVCGVGVQAGPRHSAAAESRRAARTALAGLSCLEEAARPDDCAAYARACAVAGTQLLLHAGPASGGPDTAAAAESGRRLGTPGAGEGQGEEDDPLSGVDVQALRRWLEGQGQANP